MVGDTQSVHRIRVEQNTAFELIPACELFRASPELRRHLPSTPVSGLEPQPYTW